MARLGWLVLIFPSNVFRVDLSLISINAYGWSEILVSIHQYSFVIDDKYFFFLFITYFFLNYL